MTFAQYALECGLQLLKEDTAHIRKYITNMPPMSRKAILAEYVDVWLHAMHNQPIAVKKQNTGRRAANSWILMSCTG